ncbi:DUF2339 domain-containing protein [Profundibacter amoris]|uniref:DUF2339 domain-containing protein n=1 Tax=Profundibacter amoris TaxID=2171755 RepID=UPI0013C2BAC3|nr:DUF2339 domain-containing protein [Profundibacter amoris]
MELVIPTLLLALYLLFSHLKLKKKVTELQRRVDGLQAGEMPEGVAVPPEEPRPVAENVPEQGPVTIKDVAPKSTPWKPAKTDRPEPVSESAQPRAFVFNREKTAAFLDWLQANWFLAVAALSMALAGVFFVQYGIENGYLTPFWRVMGALALGVALIAAGEWIRRRAGDEDGHAAYLPSTFSGAGLVALFAGVLAARQMYGLIGPEMALVGLVAVSALAVVLGWFYGPLLAMVGIVGATAAPFLVGGSSENGWLFYYYFALILAAGMLVDAIKRWAWVSALTLIFAFGGAAMVFNMGAGGEHFLGFALIAAVVSAMVPPLRFWPAHAGQMVSLSLFRQGKAGWPEFPTRVAAGGFAAAVLATVPVAIDAVEVWQALVTSMVLLGLAVIWFKGAPALRDLVVLPPLAFLFTLFAQGQGHGDLYRLFAAGRDRLPETSPPWDVTWLVALAALGSALMFWRGMREREYRLVWAGGAALFAPLVVATLDIWWRPVPVLGQALWAWHGMAVAIVMVLFALRCAKADGQDRRRVAIFALAVMVMITFALVVMLSDVALTLAIAVMVLLAALIDRQLNLRLLSVFMQVGGVVVGYRLVVDPGVIWAYDAAQADLLLGYGGAILLFSATWFLLKARKRMAAIVVMESAVFTLIGVFASIELLRRFEYVSDANPLIASFGLIWLISAANQLYRMKIGGWMRRVRLGLAVVFGVIGLMALAANLTFANPLLEGSENVHGPMVFDSLMLAYLMPALLFGFVALRFTHLFRWFRILLGAVASALAAFYVALEIRRFWQGDKIVAYRDTSDGELYSYTIAMLLISVGLLFFAFSKRSDLIRKAAMAGIGLTIAKVFLIDMSGLTGLTRVASFLGLGLSLSGLAWVSRRMTLQWDKGAGEEAES